MLSRYTNDCSYCHQKIIGGKHHIQKNNGIWIHQDCFHLNKKGLIPTPHSRYCDCGGDFSRCCDNPQLYQPIGMDDEPVEECIGCETGADCDSAHTCGNHSFIYNYREWIDSEICIGCETGADCDGAHTCTP